MHSLLHCRPGVVGAAVLGVALATAGQGTAPPPVRSSPAVPALHAGQPDLPALRAAPAVHTTPLQPSAPVQSAGPAPTTSSPSPSPSPNRSTTAGPTAWGVVPGGVGAAAGRSAFVHTARPGTSVTDTVRVSNFSTGPLSLDLLALDALTTPDGGFDLLGDDEASSGVGTWVRIDRGPLTLPARSQVDLPLRIEIPADAEPGDHAGGVVAVLSSVEGDGKGGRMIVRRRVGARIYLTVEGVATTALRVEDLQVHVADPVVPFGTATVVVDYRLRNTGSLRVGAGQRVTITGPGGIGAREVALPPVRQVLPGDAVTVVQRVPGTVLAGRLTAAVEARPLTPPLPAAAGRGAGRPVPGVPAATARSTRWAVPWAGLLAVFGGLALLASWRRRRIQDRTPPAPRDARPEKEQP